jgi:hypothetical protein
MSEVMLACVGLACLNTVLALFLGSVYVRNHAEVKSPFTLGLLAFAAFLVLHNGTQVWHFVTMMEATPHQGEMFLLAENVLQAGALVALATATYR